MDIKPEYIVTYKDAEGELFDSKIVIPLLDEGQVVRMILDMNETWNNGHGAGHVFEVMKIEKVTRKIIYRDATEV